MVDGSGLENRRGASSREFESHPLRQRLRSPLQPGRRFEPAGPRKPSAPRSRPLLIPLIAAFLFVLVAGVWAVFATGKVSVGCSLAPADRCLRVLFIGNSYTSANDLPGVFSRLASSGGWGVETAMVAPGGASLADHAADQGLAELIARGNGRGPWTAVIIQEQSMLPAIASERDHAMAPAAASLVRRAQMAGAQPYLLETWAHRDGVSELGMDYRAMQDAVNGAYRTIAAQTGSGLVPVGEAWQRTVVAAPSIPIWDPDGSHPAEAGTYLAACVVYQALTGASPVGLGETAGLDAAVAAALQQLAIGQ